MTKCIACGKGSLFSTDIGLHKLCNSCAGKINYSSWKKRDFQSMDELVGQKNMALQLASNNQFSNDAIKVISDYFDEYINDGYVTIINGKAGQTLKVFTNYCIINTKDIQRDSLVDALYQLLDKEDQNNASSSFDASEIKGAVNGLMRGRIVQTGVGIATSAVLKSMSKEKAEEWRRNQSKKMIVSGEYRVNLCNISMVDTQSIPDTSTGYLRFVPNGISPSDYCSCFYFFYNTSIPFQSKKIRQQVNNIAGLLQNSITQAACSVQMPNTCAMNSNNSVPIPTEDPFEVIKKYKSLLDQGIISQEEFNKKKKELLNL